jgi:hypothetical protein
MARERVTRLSLPDALSEVLTDFADLFRKEVRLARAELSYNLSAKLRGGAWLALAGALGLLTVALILGAAVAWITTYGVSLHFAFLIVAGGAALLSGISYFAGRTEAQSDLAPSRTISQVKQDIETIKEQLS